MTTVNTKRPGRKLSGLFCKNNEKSNNKLELVLYKPNKSMII